jgi:hypothetical protein
VGLPPGGVQVQATSLLIQPPPEVPFSVVYPDGILQSLHSCAAAGRDEIPADTTKNGKAAATSKTCLLSGARRRNGDISELSLAIENFSIVKSSHLPAGCSWQQFL